MAVVLKNEKRLLKQAASVEGTLTVPEFLYHKAVKLIFVKEKSHGKAKVRTGHDSYFI